MWYSVELLENGKIFIQPKTERVKHGCRGKVLMDGVLQKTAIEMLNENN